MKRNRLLVACLALLLVLSIGYALFSEQVNITGTLKGKGEFEVTLTCNLGYSDELIKAGVAASTNMNQKGFGEDSCDIVKGKVQFTTNLDYPGAKRYFTVKVENTGTIPVTFDEEKLSSEGLYDYLSTSIDTYGYSPAGYRAISSDEKEFSYYNDKGEKTTANVIKLINVGVIELGNNCSYGDECFNNFESIKTGESIYYVLAFEWPEDFAADYSFDINGEYLIGNPDYSINGIMEIPLRQITLE